MAIVGDAEDPGWRRALGGLWWVLIPGQIIVQQKRDIATGIHGLTTLRRLFASFVAALIMAGAMVVLLSAISTVNQDPLPGLVVAIAVIVYGVFSLFAPGLFGKPLACSDDRLLAASYRSRFFLRIAFADAAAVLGFVGFVESTNGWVYALGAAFAAVGLYRAAPTSANLAKDQQALAAASCPRSLVAALATLPPPTTRSRRKGTKS